MANKPPPLAQTEQQSSLHGVSKPELPVMEAECLDLLSMQAFPGHHTLKLDLQARTGCCF